MSQLVKPHGSETLNIRLLEGAERESALAAASALPKITLSSRERGDLIITWEAGQNSALDTTQISAGRDIGNVVVQRDGPDGPIDAVHDISFAFAFHAFYPKALIHTEIE